MAQTPVEGLTYYLPQTALRFSIRVEKATYTPGKLALYAGKYLKEFNMRLEGQSTYRIVSIDMQPIGLPDPSKEYTLRLDKKITLTAIDRDASGILLGLNAEGHRTQLPKAFKPSPKAPLPDPRKYLNEDILSATNTAKMAELAAREIYDIRDARAQLSRGEAEFMPKDGEQLRLMMDNLDLQEQALLSLFNGTQTKDTAETVITYIPQKEKMQDVLFRFSTKLGLVESDDLAGKPYYIAVEKAAEIPANELVSTEEKKEKDDFGLYVNIPDRIKITLLQETEPIKHYETLAGQFGKTELLSAELFGKKQTSHIILNPISGSIEKIESEILK